MLWSRVICEIYHTFCSIISIYSLSNTLLMYWRSFWMEIDLARSFTQSYKILDFHFIFYLKGYIHNIFFCWYQDFLTNIPHFFKSKENHIVFCIWMTHICVISYSVIKNSKPLAKISCGMYIRLIFIVNHLSITIKLKCADSPSPKLK